MNLTGWDRFTAFFAPRWTLQRVQSRAALAQYTRHYEAASKGRRTQGWRRVTGDANALFVAAGAELRMHARELLRNNAWARRARNIIVNNAVAWGATPQPMTTDGALGEAASTAWQAWADSTACDADGRGNFAAIQQSVMKKLVEDGEVLVRRRMRRLSDGDAIPMKLQVLEVDFLDTGKNGAGASGPIVHGVEFDALGRRIAYWLFDTHPGSTGGRPTSSRRIGAKHIVHVAVADRPGQVRGISMLAAAIVGLKDLGDFEDAELLKQKIAACFTAFVTDVDGSASPLGEPIPGSARDLEMLEPGAILHFPEGKKVDFATPPTVSSDAFATRALRKLAAGLDITYEDLTGDYSRVNYSSARMARLQHQQAVWSWQYTLLTPQFLGPVWSWWCDAAMLGGLLPGTLAASWAHPPLAMIDPEKDVRAVMMRIRNGLQTPDDALRELGLDPAHHWPEFHRQLERLDALGLLFDFDARHVSQAGQTQSAPEPPAAPAAEEARSVG